MTKKIYRISLICKKEGHIWDEGSVPVCTREGCDGGWDLIDYYCEIDEKYPMTPEEEKEYYGEH